MVSLIALDAMSDDDQPSKSAATEQGPSEAHASSIASTVKSASTPAAPPATKQMSFLEQRMAEHNQAEKACAEHLQQIWGGLESNRYDDRTIYKYRVEVRGGDIFANNNFFGGHKIMTFDASLYKYTNGRIADISDLPYHVCVFGNGLNVIGMETDMEAGLR